MADSSDRSGGNKRKRGYDARLQHGSRNKRNQTGDLGRNEYSRQPYDKRAQTEASIAKRQRIDDEHGRSSVLPAPFSQDEIAAEERKPKHKVAVMIGYSGTGYRGMQINYNEKTIEGDLFTAFVAAGAISKANANDPKKSALVRCARTDKGVHAAGNVISLKLIVEDPDIVAKINENLSPQIRVWGIQRTVSSFSCYQACDSRWYEYLIPTHCFVPPHPNSHLGKKLVQLAREVDDLEAYQERQGEVASFWFDAEEKYIKPVLDSIDESIKEDVMKALYDFESDSEAAPEAVADKEDSKQVSEAVLPQLNASTGTTHDGRDITTEHTTTATNVERVPSFPATKLDQNQDVDKEHVTSHQALHGELVEPHGESSKQTVAHVDSAELVRKKALEAAIKSLRQAYLSAKRAYRISAKRQERVASALLPFLGTINFHNFTVSKAYRDPSAKRNIKSFDLNPTPLIINGTEWLSIKIHGQSFMMHQIRKMISMIALTVRCGCPVERITETFGPETVSIPKVPGLGLLLERPVFQSYNDGAATKFGREKIDFTKFETEMLAFKQREIYERIFREEEQGNAFHTFFNHVDGYKEPQFLYVSSKGISATKESNGENFGNPALAGHAMTIDSEDEDAEPGNKGEEG